MTKKIEELPHMKEIIGDKTIKAELDKMRSEMREMKEIRERKGFKDKKNIYVCPDCLDHVVTVDLDEGVTPFMIQCQRTEGCKGMMESSMYRVYDMRMQADFEWYSPDDAERALITNINVREHVNNGGLIMRKAV